MTSQQGKVSDAGWRLPAERPQQAVSLRELQGRRSQPFLRQDCLAVLRVGGHGPVSPTGLQPQLFEDAGQTNL